MADPVGGPGVLVVTGASRGIGAACARLGAQAGYEVVVNYGRSRDAALAVVADIEKAGGAAIAVGADVSRLAEVEHLFAETDRRFGRVTALINNAGIGGAALMKETAPTIPIGRVGQPEEIAQAAIWLLSPAASYVHGTTIDVSGGR